MHYLRIFASILAALGIQNAVSAELGVRIVGESSGFSGQVMARIESLVCHHDSEVVCETDAIARPVARRLVIAIGGKGFAAVEAMQMDASVLAVFPPRQWLEAPETRRLIGVIHWDMPPARFLNLASLVNNRRTGVVTMLLSSSAFSRFPRFESLGAERGLRVLAESVEREAEVGPAIERLVANKGIFLALPDPVAQTATTIPPLLLMTYRAGVPVVAYSEAYLRAGAAVALYSTPEQIGQQVLETVANYRRSGYLPATQVLKYYSVGTNPSVLRSLGITLPSAEELESRLRQMKE